MIERTKENYEHYAKCQKPLNECLECKFVFGSMTQAEQYKYRKILRHNKQTLSLYKCCELDYYEI